MIYRLTRCFSTRDGVFGRLGKWTTVEEEWQNNKPKISCIPPGQYECHRTWYHGGGYETFEVMNVHGRSRILFHKANTEEDVEGCIGIASTMGVLQVKDEDSGLVAYKLAGLSSGPAFKEFMALFKGLDKFSISIENYS